MALRVVAVVALFALASAGLPAKLKDMDQETQSKFDEKSARVAKAQKFWKAYHAANRSNPALLKNYQLFSQHTHWFDAKFRDEKRNVTAKNGTAFVRKVGSRKQFLLAPNPKHPTKFDRGTIVSTEYDKAGKKKMWTSKFVIREHADGKHFIEIQWQDAMAVGHLKKPQPGDKVFAKHSGPKHDKIIADVSPHGLHFRDQVNSWGMYLYPEEKRVFPKPKLTTCLASCYKATQDPELMAQLKANNVKEFEDVSNPKNCMKNCKTVSNTTEFDQYAGAHLVNPGGAYHVRPDKQGAPPPPVYGIKE